MGVGPDDGDDEGLLQPAGRWDGVREKIGQLHGEASGAAWFPFKEGRVVVCYFCSFGSSHWHFGPFNSFAYF